MTNQPKRLIGTGFISGVLLIAFGILIIPVSVKGDDDPKDVSVNVSVLADYIEIELTGGTSIDFGDLVPGEPSKSGSGTEISVMTSSANGYQLFIKDDVLNSDSSLLHTDESTRIADYAGTVEVPTSWSGDGLGFCLYHGTNKDAKWGTGTTYDDANNKYAGVPRTNTLIMNKTGFSESWDLSHIGWQINVSNSQKTGAYSGIITISATPSI